MLPFLDEKGVIRSEDRMGKTQFDFNAKHPMLLNCNHYVVEKFVQNKHKDKKTRRHWTCEKPCSLDNVDPRNTKLLKNTRNDRPKQRGIRCSNSRYKCWRRVSLHRCKELAKEQKTMVLTVHMSNCESGAYTDGTQGGHRYLFCCKWGIYCPEGQTERNNQQQRDKLWWLWNKNWFNPPAAPQFGGVSDQLVKNCKNAIYMPCWGTNYSAGILSNTMCIVEQILNARLLTPVISDVNDLEALTPNHILHGNKNKYLPYLPSG